jgi:hypothetical protein
MHDIAAGKPERPFSPLYGRIDFDSRLAWTPDRPTVDRDLGRGLSAQGAVPRNSFFIVCDAGDSSWRRPSALEALGFRASATPGAS